MTVQRKRIVVMGGGTGTYTALMGLKKHPVDLTAIVTTADDGGSTGLLRDEYGLLPPGDVRQCLVALSTADMLWRDLFSFRFPEEEAFAGHTCGNIIMAALELQHGSPQEGLAVAHRLMQVQGRVIPVAWSVSNLCATLNDGTTLTGEHKIDIPEAGRARIREVFLTPQIRANSEALSAIREADLVVFGPGDLYTSILPVLLVKGVLRTLKETTAGRAFVMNLANKVGQTDGFTARTFLEEISKYLEPAALDAVIMNNAELPEVLVERYKAANEPIVHDDLIEDVPFTVIRRPLIANNSPPDQSGDVVKRSLLRHDPDMLAEAILSFL